LSAEPSQRFVVRPLADAAGKAVPTGLREALPLRSARGGWVVSLPVDAVSGQGLRSCWQSLVQRLGPGFVVAPVLAADDGGERYPTGQITVRFRGPASDGQLAAVAEQASLRLVQRTRFTDRQAVFAPAAPDAQFLPDLVDALARRDDVESTWLDAESVYRRAR